MVHAWALGLDRHQSISLKSSLAIATISEDADWWFPTPLIGINEKPQMKSPTPNRGSSSAEPSRRAPAQRRPERKTHHRVAGHASINRQQLVDLSDAGCRPSGLRRQRSLAVAAHLTGKRHRGAVGCNDDVFGLKFAIATES